MSAGDTARSAYESARTELITRLRLRDNALLFYLAIVGTLFGLGIGTKAKPEILLVIPFIAVGAGIIVAQHHEVIGALGHFLAHELHDFLTQLSPSEESPQWDKSFSLEQHVNKSMFYRVWGQLILLIIPCIASLGLNYHHAFKFEFPYGPLWWFSAFCSILTTYIIIHAHKLRKDLYKKYKW